MADYFYEGDVNDSRMLGRARWVLGIHARMGEVGSHRARARNWSSSVPPELGRELVKRAMAGLALTHLPAPPPGIPARVEPEYFGVSPATVRSGVTLRKPVRVGVYVPGEITDAELELFVILDSK